VSTPNPMEPEISRLQDAGEWVQRLNESNDQGLADQWMEWCRSDPRNLPLFEQMQSIWEGCAVAKDMLATAPQPAWHFKRRNRLIALAAGVVLLIGAAGWFALRYIQFQAFDTAIGEQRRIALADGSQLDLAPDSRVSTRFTWARRGVQLERGQAFFTVAHEATRPFIVHVNGLTVTAVGTAFDVRTGPSNTVVTVSEGRVNIAPGAPSAGGGPGTLSETVQAGVGQRVIFSKPTHRLSVATVDPKAAGSWREGNLQFVGEPLEDVVGEVNRYSTRRIAVAPALRQTRFTGTVSPANVADWLQALQQIYPIRVVYQGTISIQIRSRDDHDPRE
jgi:transmembrane sensor